MWRALFLFLCSLPCFATSITLTFDAGDPIGGLSVGDILSNQYAALTGATFSANAFTGGGGPNGNWATNTDMTIVSSTGADVGALGAGPVSGNILRSLAGWVNENGDASFGISFATGITSFSADFAGIAIPSSVRVFAYNGASLLGTVTAAGVGQQNLSLSGLGTITSVIVTPGEFNDWVGVDNITFDTLTSPVPEPSTFLLSGLGIAALTYAKRRVSNRPRL